MTSSANIAPALFAATVRSHLADPQGKWSQSHDTNAMLYAFIEASGVPYAFANIAVMEACADHWLRCVHEVGHSFLRSNLACRQLMDTETLERPNGERIERHRARTVAGSVSRLVAEFIAPFGAEAEARAALDTMGRLRAFYRFLYTRLQADSNLFAEYAPNVKAWADEGIADYLTPAEMRRIDAEIQRRAEDEARAAAVAREKRAAEEAAREKRAAAAAARKAHAAQGGA